MLFFNLTTDVDLPAEAIILWMESNTCPAGYTKISTSNFYLAAGNIYNENAGAAHYHPLEAHTHAWSGTTTGEAGGYPIAYGPNESAQARAGLHTHTVAGETSNSGQGNTANEAIPGLAHFDVVLCKKN